MLITIIPVEEAAFASDVTADNFEASWGF